MLMTMSPDFPGCGTSQWILMPHPGSVHQICDCTKMATSSAAVAGYEGSEQAEREWRGNDHNEGRSFIYLPQIWWGPLKVTETISPTPT